MAEKRFTITQDFEENYRQIRDNGHIIMGCFVEPQAEVIVELLNELSEENEQLKEHQRTLEAKIVRLKDRVKTFEKHYGLKDIERYKKMDNCNCIDSRRLDE